jgi:proteasome assembly chaperone (PAC2) family protein
MAGGSLREVTEHVRWLGDPPLRQPTVIAAFTGWNDAGDAASNSVRHLVEQWPTSPLAEIDPEEFTDFATVRPHVRLNEASERTIVWPTVAAWHASTPGGDVILVLGPEPALRWRLFSEQVVGIAQRYHASMVLTLGALLADVPHSRPVQLIGTATDQSMIASTCSAAATKAPRASSACCTTRALGWAWRLRRCGLPSRRTLRRFRRRRHRWRWCSGPAR